MKMGVVKQNGNILNKPSFKPPLVGWLNIIGGLILFFTGIFWGWAFVSCSHSYGGGGFLPGIIAAVIYFILGILAIKGGRNALEREKWGHALSGSICVVLGDLPFTLILFFLWESIVIISVPFILTVILFICGASSIILVSLSKREFS